MLDIYKTVKTLHDKLISRCREASDNAKVRGTTKSIADGVLIARKCAEMLKDSQREVERLQTELSKLGCLLLATKGDGEPLQGKYCTAYAKVKTSCNLPSYSKNPEEYDLLCSALGLEANRLTRLHWPAVTEHLSEIVSNGGNVPEVFQPYKQFSEAYLVATERAENNLENDATYSVGLLGESPKPDYVF